MLDNDLIKLFLPILNTGLVDAGFSSVKVKQSNQPTQQGVNSLPTIYFFKVGDRRFGNLKFNDAWDSDSETMIHTEIQMYETTFQFSCLAIQNPSNTNLYTASDLINLVCAILQSESTRLTLINSGVGLLRVSEIRNPYFTDDRDMFEAVSSFDIIFSHPQTRISSVPVVDALAYNIKRV